MSRWRYAAATDTGLVRDSNEDAIYVDGDVAIVADGMGGHAAGEVASRIAVEVVAEEFRADPTVNGLYKAIESANRLIMDDARENPERFGMGTTIICVGLTFDSHGVVAPTLFNVGDSRAYQLRDGALRQLSEDHSVAEEWVRMGRLTPEEAAVHPRRHQLTRTLGIDGMLDIDVVSVNATPGDRILLCSDGLSNELSPEVLARIACAPTTLEDAVEELVRAAKEAGGRDNISAILLEFDEVNVAANPIKKTVSTAPPPVASSATTRSVRQSRRRARFTWRSALAALVGVGVVVGFFFVMHWYAYSSYYLAPDAGVIAVYRGQPNGVLWYKPVKVLDTSYSSHQLRSVDEHSLAVGISEPSLDAALQYANYLHTAWTLSQAASVTPVTPVTTTTLAGVQG